MTCFYCKANLEKGYTTHVTELKNCIVIIKNVPCMKCTQCGEVLLTGTTLMQIEEMLDKCENNMTEVAILNFNNSAA